MPSPRPTLSIIVPVLNEAAVIEPVLRALQALRRQGHELVVADGGSVDATAELALPWADQVIAAPRGRARQMNAGAAVSRGEWLWFVHVDSVVAPAIVEQLLEATRGPVTWGRFDVRLSGTARALRLVERLMNHRSRLTGIATGDQAIFVRRRVFEAVGGFSEIPLMEDIALSRRLKAFDRPVCLPGPLVTSSRRWEQNGIWRTIFLMWRLRLAYFLGADPQRLHARYYGSQPPR